VWKATGKGGALALAYLALFLGGSAALGPVAPAGGAPGGAALAGVLAVAAIDTALLGAWIHRARHRGLRLWAEAAVALYGIKTLSSALEVWWFVDRAWIPDDMLPNLFAMTVPLALAWPALAVWALGPAGPPDPTPPLGRSAAATAARIALAGAVAYPALFFSFGYFVAWQAAPVRAYYGGPAVPLPFVEHLAWTFAEDPWVLPFEMLRGLLWVALGWPVLRWTRGPWWVGGLLFAATLAAVQNDVHLLPNPLMPDAVRLWHLVETSSSNLLFGLLTALLLAPRGALASAHPDVREHTAGA
jgi:hypothetical protein